MSEIISAIPIKIITGPCQTSDRNGVAFLKDLSTIRVTNPNGVNVQAIAGGRLCTVKSRTELNPLDENRVGMGVDFKVWEQFSKQVIAAIRQGSQIPPHPIMQGGLWAEEIQSETGGMPLAFEAMDWIHAMLMLDHISPGTGTAWIPSVQNLGETVELVSEVVGDHQGIIGIKGPKFYPAPLPRNLEDGPTSMEKTWSGLGMYALGATSLPREIMLIERGRDQENEGGWRNVPDHNSARMAKQMLRNKIATRGLAGQVQVSMAYDPSHTNGPLRRDRIVQDSIDAATQMDITGEMPLYDVLLVESTDKNAPLPLSDAGQHITGEEVQDVVDGIAKTRAVKGFK